VAEGFKKGEIIIDRHGQIAGAYYGEEAIPKKWWKKTNMKKAILTLAKNLFR
jgi:ADP-ribosylglycohydrolase